MSCKNVSCYIFSKDLSGIEGRKGSGEIKPVENKTLKFDIVINDCVQIFQGHMTKRFKVLIDNNLNNHNEILSTIQNILKESL